MAIAALAAAPAPAAHAQAGLPDTASLATGPGSAMETRYQRTFLRVNVLTLRVRFGVETAARLRRAVEGRRLTPGLADTVAAAALEARDAWAHLRFHRNLSLRQFLGGIRDNARAAREAGIIAPAEFAEIDRDLPAWYAFLAERGIRRDDEMFYRIRGDTLRTVYRAADGQVLLDQTDTGSFRRLSVLGGYFAPGSDFRQGLIRSLFP
jgi:hypothetical protein